MLRIPILFERPFLGIPVLLEEPFLGIPVLFEWHFQGVPILFEGPGLVVPILFERPSLRVPILVEGLFLRVPISFVWEGGSSFFHTPSTIFYIHNLALHVVIFQAACDAKFNMRCQIWRRTGLALYVGSGAACQNLALYVVKIWRPMLGTASV